MYETNGIVSNCSVCKRFTTLYSLDSFKWLCKDCLDFCIALYKLEASNDIDVMVINGKKYYSSKDIVELTPEEKSKIISFIKQDTNLAYSLKEVSEGSNIPYKKLCSRNLSKIDEIEIGLRTDDNITYILYLQAKL